MPSKGRKKVSHQQRVKIATGRMLGKSRQEIADETGLAISTVAHQAADPRTATLILRLKHLSEPQLERTWKSAVNGLERDVKAKDPDVRRHARGQFFRLLSAGDPPLLRIAPADNSGGDFTLEELLVTYRRATVRSA